MPPSLEEWLGPEHPARFIRDLVDSLDLQAAGFRVPECRAGRPPFAADLLLKVLLYGFFEKIRSFRKLEWACLNMVPMIWLTGQHYPDHNTIWRFWDSNRSAMRGLFRTVVHVAHEVGLVGVVLHAVDGTKLAAQMSRRSGWHRKDLERLLEEALGQIESEMDRAAALEREDAEYRMSEELQDARRRKEAIAGALAALDAAGTDHLHPKEPEARMMKCGRVKDLAYNAQAVVDSQSGLIVGTQVSAEQNDSAQLGPMLDQVEENLGQTAQQTVADGGYWSPQQLAEAQQQGREVLVNAPPQVKGKAQQEQQEQQEEGEKPYHKSQFRHDADKDVFVCPEGKELEHSGSKPARHDKDKRLEVYRCRSYKDCPVRSQCSRQDRGRTIERDPNYEAVVRQVQKQKTAQCAAQLARRKEIVEPVFGILKEAHGFRRWSVVGLAKVRAQWSLMCTVLNLRKLYGPWLAGAIRWPHGCQARGSAGG